MIRKIVCSLMAFLILAGVISAASLSPFDKVMIQVSNAIAKSSNIPKNTKMAVIGFSESSTKKQMLLSSVIEDDLSTRLINMLPNRIIAKNHIDTVLKELKITRDDVFDSRYRKDFGKLLSADLIVTGTYWIDNDYVNINIVVIEIESGLALFSNKARVSKSSFPKEWYR